MVSPVRARYSITTAADLYSLHVTTIPRMVVWIVCIPLAVTVHDRSVRCARPRKVIRDMAFDALEIEQGQKMRTDGRSSTGRTEHVVAKMHLQLT